MPSSFCEPSAGISDSDPGERPPPVFPPSLGFLLGGKAIGVGKSDLQRAFKVSPFSAVKIFLQLFSL